MNDFLYYLLKVSGIFITLYLFYRLFLIRLTFHLFNRLFLLAIIPLSLMIPLWTINYTLPSFASPAASNATIVLEEEITINPVLLEPVVVPKAETAVWNWRQMVGWGYALGVLIYLWSLFGSIVRLVRLKQRSIACRDGSFSVISAPVPSIFSCFKRIFIPQSKIKDCEKSILEHEKLHGKAWHSLDLFVTELFIALLWFNPFVYLFRKTLRSVHEFQIDSMLLRKQNIAITDYLQLIAENLFVNQKMSVVSNYFNCITIKKRIIMITKTKTSKSQMMRYVFIIPVVALLSVCFSTYAEKKEDKNSSTTVITVRQDVGSSADDKPNDVTIIKMSKDTSRKANGTVLVTAKSFSKDDWEARADGAATSHKQVVVQGHKGGEAKSSKVIIINSSSNQTSEPLIIIDGAEANSQELQQIHPNGIAHISVLKDTSATTIYGARGKDGVILVTTKKGDAHLYNLQMTDVIHDTNVVMVAQGYKQNANGVKVKKKLKKRDITKNPLIFIDGEEKDAMALDQLAPETIGNISILKDAAATGAYGERAKDGVLLVTTKKGGEGEPSGNQMTNAIHDTNVVMVVAQGYKKDTNAVKIKIRNAGDNLTNPLVFIDEKEKDREALAEIDPNNIESISVLQGEQATAVYGERAKDGILLVTTKKGGEGEPSGNQMTNAIHDDVVVVAQGYKKDDNAVKIKIRKAGDNLTNPLVFIDEKEKDKEALAEIDPNKIKSITVLQDAQATAVYGERAKDGAILVITKKFGDEEIEWCEKRNKRKKRGKKDKR